jgi:predicted transcriptional regulator
MKPQTQKGMLESLPRDMNRQAVLKALLEAREPVKTRDLVSRMRTANPEVNIDAPAAAEIVKSAIREGLIDIAGDGAEMRVQLTPFGSDVARNIERG